MKQENRKFIETELALYELANQIHSKIYKNEGRAAASKFERIWLDKARNWDELSWEERTALEIKLQNEEEAEVEFNLDKEK